MNANTKRFFPVIHCIDPKFQGIGHAINNARIAFDNLADGIFLIGHGLHYSFLCNLYEQVRKQFPKNWIGINFLDIIDNRKLEQVIKTCFNINAVWIDDMPDKRLVVDSRIEVFGGVAFKYINPDQSGKELVLACANAIKLVDVITTSGNKTGSPPNTKKIEEIRKYIGESRLALASGVTLENIQNFLPTINDFLVASSLIEKNKDKENFEYFIPEKLSQMASIIHK